MFVSAIILLFVLKPICSDTTAGTEVPAEKEVRGESVGTGANTAAPFESTTKEIDKRLFVKIKEIALQCAKDNKINVGDCLEMFNEFEDLRQPKYHQCKCWIPCVAKQLDLMKDEDYKLDSIRTLIDQLETKPWRNEASRIFELCTDGKNACSTRSWHKTFFQEKSELSPQKCVTSMKFNHRTEGGSGCEGGFNMISCMMDHSEKAVQTGKHLLAAIKDEMTQ